MYTPLFLTIGSVYIVDQLVNNTYFSQLQGAPVALVISPHVLLLGSVRGDFHWIQHIPPERLAPAQGFVFWKHHR